MNPETLYLAGFIAVATVATFMTRLLPFIVLGRYAGHPLLQYLGRYLPAGIMAVLVVIFLLRSGDWQAPVFGLNALIPAVLVGVLHLWRRNALLSILAGTVCYIILINA